tara:strand:- start:372 stop:590 length:219 start_codon:yes stop_codon:yes gene_type:complete
MSKLSERCEQRKQEAEALAEKFNALDAEEKKIANEKAQIFAEFNVKNAQYAELLAQVKDEETSEQPVTETVE